MEDKQREQRTARSLSPQSRSKSSPKPGKIHGYIMASHPLLGTFTHAPRSNTAGAKYFEDEIVPVEEHQRRKELRNNPFTGQFHSGPREYSRLHNLKQFEDPLRRTVSVVSRLEPTRGAGQRDPVTPSARTFANRHVESNAHASQSGLLSNDSPDLESTASMAPSDASTNGRVRSQSACDDSTGWRSESSEVSSPRSTLSGKCSPRFRSLSGSLSPVRRSRRPYRPHVASPDDFSLPGTSIPRGPPAFSSEPEHSRVKELALGRPALAESKQRGRDNKSRSRAQTSPETRRLSRKSVVSNGEVLSRLTAQHSRSRSQSDMNSDKSVRPPGQVARTSSATELPKSASAHSPPVANYYASTRGHFNGSPRNVPPAHSISSWVPISPHPEHAVGLTRDLLERTGARLPRHTHSSTDLLSRKKVTAHRGSVGADPREVRSDAHRTRAGLKSRVWEESTTTSWLRRQRAVNKAREGNSKRSPRVVNRDQNPWAVNKSSPVYEKYAVQGNKDKSFLGGGTYSDVRTVVHMRKGTLHALKVVKKRYLLSEEEKEMVQREVEIHQVLRHRNIIRLCEIFEDSDHLYLVLERANYGNLEKLSFSRRNITEAEACHIMIQMFRAIAYLHENGVLHADIKPSNILLDCPTVPRIANKYSEDSGYRVPITDLVVKICDFGLSRKVPDVKYYKYTSDVNLVPYTEIRGTVGYIAPEILGEKPYGIAADCWSAGVIMFELIGQMKPFMPYGDCLHIPVQFPNVIWGSKSALCASMIRKLLQIQASKRMTAKEALEDPWIQLFTLPNGNHDG